MTAIGQLLALVDEGFDRKAWHGPTLRGALRGVGAAQAAWRPEPAMHNIWELTIYAAYWKYAVRRMLLGDKRGSFPLKGSNWFERPPARAKTAAELDAAWRADVRLLQEEHRKLRAAVEGVAPSGLGRRVRGSTSTMGYLVRGIAAHDLYHAGQVQLLKRLYKERRAKAAS